MKTLFGLSALGFGGSTVLSQVAPSAEMAWYDKFAQFGFGGICLAIIAYMIVKTIPDLLKNHQAAVQNVVDAHGKCIEGLSCNLGEKMDHMAAEIRAGNDSQLALLRANLHKKEGGS